MYLIAKLISEIVLGFNKAELFEPISFLL